MTTSVAQDPVALVASQVTDLQAQLDALDRGVVQNGVVASRALARATALEAVLRAALDRNDDEPGATASFGDPVVAKLAERRRSSEARRRRIAASGFRLIAGDAS